MLEIPSRTTGKLAMSNFRMRGADNVVGQFINLVFDLGLDFQGSGVDVGAPDKPDCNSAVSLGGNRGHLLDARNGRNDLLENPRDQPLQHLRAGPFALCLDVEGGKLDVGKKVNPQTAQGHGTENHDDQGRHGTGKDRPLDTGITPGSIDGRPLVLGSGRVFLPGNSDLRAVSYELLAECDNPTRRFLPFHLNPVAFTEPDLDLAPPNGSAVLADNEDTCPVVTGGQAHSRNDRCIPAPVRAPLWRE